ncbi:ATP-dependent DNA helicase 2 subunit KU70 [Raphanus sativus]|uniref:ATP-dependent DNA helicase 2 subunit KU70 n=1 Tax=Raphanus sativus TaxID=3726 RepID=A0A6J0LFS5_RAPSA|nr:ATP-dependent DNA helicase 2 subunit KU70 [Raphanus sativus]KAJ4915997.1 ATP-dependent DNA helicase 2 subunit KU70 [Raphanus sativus]
MELDPEDVFRDEDEDPESQFFQEKEASKEFVVYLIDASPKMFSSTCPSEDEKQESHFHIAVSCIAQSLKSHIINRFNDEIAICFFNTREKKNLQELNGVYVFNDPQRECIDRPTARLIKDFDVIEESFIENIGSQNGIVSDSRENSLYSALWVAQALLRKGSSKTADKRIFLFTNEDDPFGSMRISVKEDMTRTTLQRAKDAQDLGISIELLPLSHPDKQFDISLFYKDLIGLNGDELTEFMPSVGQKLEDMKDQLKKRVLAKRIAKRITFMICDGVSIELNGYALLRPATPGTITWLDSTTNLPIKVERSYVCADTGAIMQEPIQRIQPYINQNVMFTAAELSELKKITTGHLRLLGFKPLSCLKDYHNMKPSTFLYPTDKEVIGSTRAFIALHRSMIQLGRFAVAFYGGTTPPRLVALVAQDEIESDGGQVEPPGMNMIYLPYSNDIRDIEELHSKPGVAAPRASDDQLKKASALMRRLELKDFSVCQFANPALQRHYAMLQAIALDQEDIGETRDETLPDKEGMNRPTVVKAIEEFKESIYGDDSEEESDSGAKEKSRKRKAADAGDYDFVELAKSGKLKDLTVVELKTYLTANSLPLGGKKDALINRILAHLSK